MLTTNWENEKRRLWNWGILPVDDVPTNITDYLKSNITDFKFNHQLAGHIQEEFRYKNWPNFIDQFILEKTKDPVLDDYTKRQKQLTSDRPFVMDDLWVNKQKKYEFNPLHEHGGVFSFIIFLKIPYDLEEESKVFPKNSTGSSTSKLCFLVSDYLGDIKDIVVDVDKSFENKMLMFPAKLKHQVYPFYTSDDYRITVSGNIAFWVEDKGKLVQ